MKLREKYNSQNFSNDKDDIVERLKQKTKQLASPVEEYGGFTRSTSLTERMSGEGSKDRNQ
jgi:hypothetical protein